MQLIGMLDSPYVRRTAISLRMLGIPFEHRPLSVFGDFDAFHAINPLVKAPTLVCDDGSLLVDSTLIIDYAESLAGRSLLPSDRDARRHALHLIGLATVVYEKTVQHVYELKRPEARRDAAWLQRVDGQLHQGCALLDAAVAKATDHAWLCGKAPTQADISVGVAWTVTQIIAPGLVAAADYPAFAAFAARAERLPEFMALPPV